MPLRSGARIALLAAAAACAAAVPAEPPASIEGLKAQVLARVLLFVHWPPGEAGTPLNLCIAGDSALARALGALDGSDVNDRPLRVRRTAGALPRDCRVVYLAPAESAALPALQGQPVLTVTDTQGQLERGAIVSLQIDGTRVAFDVGLGAARAAGIDFSAKLLRLARYVKEDPGDAR